ENLPGTRRRHRTVLEYNLATDDDERNSLCILMWHFKRRCIAYARGIEHHKVGLHAMSDRAAVAQAETLRGQGGHFAQRLLHLDHFALAHVNAEHANERAIVTRMRRARMRVAQPERDLAIRCNHGGGMLKDALDVGFAHDVALHSLTVALLEE